MVSVNDKIAVEFHLSGGECHDAPEGRKSMKTIGRKFKNVPYTMDKAYEGDETRKLARKYGHEPIVPPKSNRKEPWEYDEEIYKGRNVVERLFRRLKGFRRICTRYDKTDDMFEFYIHFAFIMLWLD